MGESQILEKINEAWVKQGEEKIPVELILRYPCNVISSNIAIAFDFKGTNFIIPTA